MRIGLYPLVSCMLNISASVLDLYEVKHLESTEFVRLLSHSSHAQLNLIINGRRTGD